MYLQAEPDGSEECVAFLFSSRSVDNAHFFVVSDPVVILWVRSFGMCYRCARARVCCAAFEVEKILDKKVENGVPYCS